jgi:DNA adenine methylase
MADGSRDPQTLRSPLKWAGGKARTAATLAHLAPPDGFMRYIEPFCGSAAVFFAIRPGAALLADAVPDLIVCLRAIRDEPNALMALLDEMPNNQAYFDALRKIDGEHLDELSRAARTLYFNKTAFRGLWRVNRHGEFNTPYGQYNRPYYNRETLLAASAALRCADLVCADFRETLQRCGPGDWVYLDPPYVPDRKWGDFTRYTPGKFGPNDQNDLAAVLKDLDSRGVKWLLTNSNTTVARALYRDWRLAVLPTRRDIALTVAERGSVDLVVSNYACAPGATITGHGEQVSSLCEDARGHSLRP